MATKAQNCGDQKQYRGMLWLVKFVCEVYWGCYPSFPCQNFVWIPVTWPTDVHVESHLIPGRSKIGSTSAVASSIIGGGAHIHIFVFTDHKNNRFQKKLIKQNTNIWIWASLPPPIIELATALSTNPMHSHAVIQIISPTNYRGVRDWVLEDTISTKTPQAPGTFMVLSLLHNIPEFRRHFWTKI
jgi:hypothetical protein